MSWSKHNHRRDNVALYLWMLTRQGTIIQEAAEYLAARMQPPTPPGGPVPAKFPVASDSMLIYAWGRMGDLRRAGMIYKTDNLPRTRGMDANAGCWYARPGVRSPNLQYRSRSPRSF